MKHALVSLLGLILICTPIAVTAQEYGDWVYTTNGDAITIAGYTGLGGSVTIPSNIYGMPVTSIADGAFSDFTGLTSVGIPDGVTTIGNLAFSFCSSLISVSLPNTLTSMGGSFYSCSSLTNIAIPINCTNVGGNAFCYCIRLTNVTIWSSAPTIGSSTFAGCSGLESVFFMGNAPSINSDHSVFYQDNATVYYMPGTTGWGTATFDGLPAKLWSASPVITQQPKSVTTNGFAAVSFGVVVNGTQPLSYQWSFNGTNVAGGTSSTLTITNVTQYDLGAYSVVVTNAYGTATSSNAVLSMYPFIDVPFAGAVTYWGENATLSVQGWGTGPLSYQWLLNGAAIPNATNQTLSLTSIQFTNAGLYSVIVSSPLGSVTNTPAQVVVNAAGVSLGVYPGVTVSGVIGYTYSIQSSTDLTDTNAWTTVATLTLTQPEQLWVDTTVNAASASNPHRFYRVLPGP